MPGPDRVSRSRIAVVEPVPLATYALDIVALAVLSNALLPLLWFDETIMPGARQQGSVLLRSLNAAVYALYAVRFLLNIHAREALRYLVNNDWKFWLPVAALLTLALASMAWSSEPLVALRRAFALIGTTGVGVYLALRYPPRMFLQLLLGVSVVFAIASIAMVILWPEKGVMHVSTMFADEHEGRWRGVFLHKNHLASLMAVGVVVAAGVLRGRGSRLFVAVSILLLCMGILLVAESLTALVATIVALLGMAILRLLAFGTHDRRENLLAFFPVLLLVTAVTLYQYSQGTPEIATEEVSVVVAGSGADVHAVAPAASLQELQNRVKPQREGFRRNATATGRLNMWRLSWDAIQLHPLRGYGYGTFWRTDGPAEQLWERSRFRMPHAHNGWVDVALQLGVPLTLLLVGWMLWLGARVLRGVRGDCGEWDKTAAITLFGLWLCLNVVNLAETVLFRQNEILSVLIFSIAVFTTLKFKWVHGEIGNGGRVQGCTV
jgi:exopolysaccharide production protein ExoQ